MPPKKGGEGDTYRVIKTRTESRRSSGNIYNLKYIYFMMCMRAFLKDDACRVGWVRFEMTTSHKKKKCQKDTPPVRGLDSSCSFEVWTRRYETVSSEYPSEGGTSW